MVWCVFFGFFFLQDIEGKPNWSGLCGACVLWNVLTTEFSLNEMMGLAGRREWGWKNFSQFYLFCIFLEMLGMAWSLGIVPLNKADKKTYAKGLFFWEAGSVRAESFCLELMGHCLCSALLRYVRDYGQRLVAWSATGNHRFWSQGQGAVVLIHKTVLESSCFLGLFF